MADCLRPIADLADCPPAKRNRGKPGLRIGDAGPMGRILVDGEPGNDFIPGLKPRAGELVLAKPGKGAFYGTNLDPELKRRGITHLVVTGVTTEVCVQTTMREANDRGYECLLVEDGTESYFPEFKQSTLDIIRAQGGIVGWTAPTDTIVNARVLLMVNYRPEYQDEWVKKSHYSQLRLESLLGDNAAAMLNALVGDSAELDPLRGIIIERTQGNPFFIEEMLQALFDEGALVRNGTVKITRPLGQLRMPFTVQGILAARIDRLPLAEKDLLQTLAVVGAASSAGGDQGDRGETAD